MKQTTSVSLLAFAVLLSAVPPVFAGTLTITSGPTFTPSTAFTNNEIQFNLLTNPPGVTGDVLHFIGPTTIVPSVKGTATIEVQGTYTGVTYDNFSAIDSLTINSTSTIPVSFQSSTTVIVEPIGFTISRSSGPREVLPGLNQYRLETPAFSIDGFHGTYDVSFVFTFGSSSVPITSGPGTLDVSFQQLDWQLAPELAEFTPQFQLLNISTRASVETGDNVLIGGFIITGTAAKQILLRAIGPSLSGMNVDGALADPILELHKPDGTVVTNDNWRDTQAQEIIDTGIPPTNDQESAIVATLDPGAYTAIVRGVNDTTGVGLVEVYDLDDQPAVSQLANISTRGKVETADGVLIGGFISGPEDFDPSPVVIRALGPTLTGQGVTDALADPVLNVYDTNGDVIASNDNWMDGPDAQAIAADGLAPGNDLNSVVLIIPAPGSYTAIVSGQGGSVGVALVEAYRLNQP